MAWTQLCSRRISAYWGTRIKCSCNFSKDCCFSINIFGKTNLLMPFWRFMNQACRFLLKHVFQCFLSVSETIFLIHFFQKLAGDDYVRSTWKHLALLLKKELQEYRTVLNPCRLFNYEEKMTTTFRWCLRQLIYLKHSSTGVAKDLYSTSNHNIAGLSAIIIESVPIVWVLFFPILRLKQNRNSNWYLVMSL